MDISVNSLLDIDELEFLFLSFLKRNTKILVNRKLKYVFLYLKEYQVKENDFQIFNKKCFVQSFNKNTNFKKSVEIILKKKMIFDVLHTKYDEELLIQTIDFALNNFVKIHKNDFSKEVNDFFKKEINHKDQFICLEEVLNFSRKNINCLFLEWRKNEIA